MQIQRLVLQSYTKGVLDEKKVHAVSKLLKRSELKRYIKTIKKWENKSMVTIVLSSLPTEKEKKAIKKIYPKKKLVFSVDPSLLLGVKIINDDVVYDLTIKNTLDNMVSYISQA